MGIFFAVFAVPDAPLEVALGTAAFFGTFFGASFAVLRWKSWPAGRKLTASERIAAARAVFGGEDTGGTALAPAVSELAGVVIKNAERSRSQRWPLWIVLAAAVASAVDETATSAVPQAPLAWLLVGLLLWTIARLPRRLARSEACAVRAKLLALDRMHT